MSTVAQRVQLGPFFSAGTIQGAAKLYHYAAGTSTLKNIWSDRAQVTTLAQPFVADANGIFNFFADGIYKLIVCGPNSTGPAVDVLYTLDNWSFLDPTDPTFDEGTAIASSSAISVGPEVWAHITGSTNIDTIGGTIPFFWAVFDGNLTLNYSASLLTPASINLAVRQGDVVFFLNEGSNVWRVAAHYQVDGLLIATQDSRTNTVDVPLTVQSTTSGTPAAGIGTGIDLKAESADETPSDVLRLTGTFSDVGAGTEDSYFSAFLRVAGAALTEVYRWVAIGAFKAIFTHTNTADRTYYLTNRSTGLGGAQYYDGPSSIGSGSTRTLETFTSATGNLSGVHFYDGDFTLNSGHTLTVPAGKKRLVIFATGTITISGTITAVGAGGAGGATSNGKGGNGTDSSGGGADAVLNGTGSGGDVQINGCVLVAGGNEGQNGVGAAGAGASASGSDNGVMMCPWLAMGGAGGGGSTSNVGGAGGGSIVLVAPTVILSATAVLNTSGSNGAGALGDGGGGGGSGSVYVITRAFTDSGATFTQTVGTGAGGVARSGGAGVKQILIYA